MTEALGDILRASLSDADARTTLRDEPGLLERYLYIQNIRYKGNIVYETAVRDPALLDCRVPRFLLHPLVENAILHGIESGQRGGGRTTLTVWCGLHSLYPAAEDDGAGIPPDRLARLVRGLPPLHDRGNDRGRGGRGDRRAAAVTSATQRSVGCLPAAHGVQ